MPFLDEETASTTRGAAVSNPCPGPSPSNTAPAEIRRMDDPILEEARLAWATYCALRGEHDGQNAFVRAVGVAIRAQVSDRTDELRARVDRLEELLAQARRQADRSQRQAVLLQAARVRGEKP